MMLIERGHRAHNIHRIDTAQHAGLGRIGFRHVDMAKPRAKGLTCKACDGKRCVGRCRFEKLA